MKLFTLFVLTLLVAPFVAADPNDRDDYYKCLDENIESFGGSGEPTEGYGSVRGENGPYWEWNGESWVQIRGQPDDWGSDIVVTGTETEVRYSTPHVYDKIVLYETVDIGEQKAVIHPADFSGVIQTTGGQGLVFFMCHTTETGMGWYRGEFPNDFLVDPPTEVPEFGLVAAGVLLVAGAGLVVLQRK